MIDPHGPSTELDLDPHEDFLSYEEIQERENIPTCTLRQWKRRGHLLPGDIDDRGRPLFSLVEVWRAQARVSRRRHTYRSA